MNENVQRVIIHFVEKQVPEIILELAKLNGNLESIDQELHLIKQEITGLDVG